MWLVLQIAVGVALGLGLFRWYVSRPAIPFPSTKGLIGICAFVYGALWIVHLMLTAYR